MQILVEGASCFTLECNFYPSEPSFLAPSSHTHDSIFELTFPLFYHVGSKTLGYSQITHNDSLAIGFAQHSVAHSHMFDGWSSHRFPPSSSPPTSEKQLLTGVSLINTAKTQTDCDQMQVSFQNMTEGDEAHVIVHLWSCSPCCHRSVYCSSSFITRKSHLCALGSKLASGSNSTAWGHT